MKRIKEMYYKFTDVLNYKNQIKILRKQVEELKKEPQQLIDKMNLMKWEIGDLKLQIKHLNKELKKYEK